MINTNKFPRIISDKNIHIQPVAPFWAAKYNGMGGKIISKKANP
jgi:hypothetical protein